ncbi:MAG: hypothetical protein J6S41_01665 [Clostridia bacterium]|nr:hypothetical protein [Clostridia bacterium]
MFGYIRPQMPELRVRDVHYYRGVYCGLCRAQGRCTGQCSRMTLSYDYVFLSLLRLALENGNPAEDGTPSPVAFDRRRCLPHPIRRRLSLRAGRVSTHVARCAALLNYHKLCDDRKDERKWSRAYVKATLLYLPLRHMYRRAAAKDAALAAQLATAMNAFAQTEVQALPSADAPAAAFGEATAILLSYGLQGRAYTVARHLGTHIGKWLYFADAVDDYTEDVAKDRFNPLRALYGDGGLTEENRAAIATAMGHELMQADDALALLDYDDARCGGELRPLLTHMLQIALPALTHALADGSYGEGRRPRGKRSAMRSMDADAASVSHERMTESRES